MARVRIEEIKPRLNDRAEEFCRRYLKAGNLDPGDKTHWKVGSIYNTAPKPIEKGGHGGSTVVDISGERVGQWHDFSGDTHGDLLDVLKAQFGKGWLKEAKHFLGISDEGGAALPARVTPRESNGDESAEAAAKRKADLAHKMFTEGKPLGGTHGADYLRGRGLEVDPWPDVFRFCPRGRFKPADKDGRKAYVPMLLARISDGGGAPLGIQRIALDPDNPTKKHPDKEHAKLSLGPVRGGSIQFTGGNKIVALCEGPEKGLGLYMIALAGGWLEEWPLAIWAVAGVSTMPGVDLRPECEEVWIFADLDTPDAKGRCAGQAMAEKASSVFLAQGKRVKVMFPPKVDEDWDDLIVKHGLELAAEIARRRLEKARLKDPTSDTAEHVGSSKDGDEGSDATGARAYDEDAVPSRDYPSARADNREVLRYVGGELHTLVESAQAALAAHVDIFQRGGQLVRIVRVDAPTTPCGIKRQSGALTIVAVDADYLVVQLTRVICWQKFDARSHKWRDIDAPRPIAYSILAIAGAWAFPPLRAIIEAPTLRPDGTVLDQAGYDLETGIYFDNGGVKYEAIPRSPTHADALASLDLLSDVLRGFPFIDADAPDIARNRTSSFAVVISAITTALVRRSLRTAPLFGFTAPTMASGKSLLADMVAIIATGRPAAVMSYTNDPAEDRKRLLAALIAGDSVVSFDNVEESLGSDALCSILTQQSYRDRMLGVSQNITVPTCATFLATGNNLSIKGDLSTRALMCHLDPGCERPEERKFDVDLYTDVPKRRPELVKATLTILRAYIVAGRPEQEIAPFGRFDEWSDLVRSALVWLGLKDPCGSRSSVESGDSERARLGNLLAAWEAAFGSKPTEVADVIQIAKTGQGTEADQLRKSLAEWMERGEVNARRLGWFIRKMAGRIQGGLRFEKNSDKGKSAAIWVVRQVTK